MTTNLSYSNSVLPSNNKKLTILYILLLLGLLRQNMSQIFGVLQNRKYWHFCVKFVVLRNPFFDLVFMYIEEGVIYNVWGHFFKMVNINHNIKSFPRGKQSKNLFPKVSSTNWHSAATNPFSSLPTTSFVKKK